MKLEQTEETGHLQSKEEPSKQQLSDRKKREARIDDYLLLAVKHEFAIPIPIPSESSQPDDLLKLAAPHLPPHILRDKRNPPNGLDFECELVFVASESEKQPPRLAAQRTTSTAISREFVDPSAKEILRINFQSIIRN